MGVNAGVISITVESFPIFEPTEYRFRRLVDKKAENLFGAMLHLEII